MSNKSTVLLMHMPDDVTGCDIRTNSTEALCAMLGVFVESIISEKYLSVYDVFKIVNIAANERGENERQI